MMAGVDRKKIRVRHLVLFVVLGWIGIAGIDRLVWVNAGGGLNGYIGKDAGAAKYPGCEGRLVEYKGDSNSLEYRCSTIGSSAPLWPFQHTGKLNPN